MNVLWHTGFKDGANNAVPAVADVNGDGKLELGVAGCNEGFRCMDGEGLATKLELVEVREGPQAPGLEQFSLVFQDGQGVGTGHLLRTPGRKHPQLCY